MSLLQVENLQVRYGQVQGTRSVSFSLDAGGSLALVGSNGAGKSSTVRAIMGMVGVQGGDIRLNGRSIVGQKPSQIVRLGISLSPEGRRVFPLMSVHDNLRAGAYTLPAEAFEARAAQIYGYFPRLYERRSQRASSLSGGEQQMLAIGRALMSRPQILLLDEPSLGVAPIILERIADIVAEIRRAENVAILLAEQNANWALRMVDAAVVLELGTSSAISPAAELLNDPAVQRAYLGV